MWVEQVTLGFLTAAGNFDDVMGMYVVYTGLGFLSLLGRYINRINSEEPTQAETAGMFGILKKNPKTPYTKWVH